MSLKQTLTLTATAGLTLAVATLAAAQLKEIPGEMVTVKGTVEAIDHTNRVLTLTMEDGVSENVYVPMDAPRFDEVKVGNTIQARYYDNVVVRVKKPGEPDVNMAELGGTATKTPGASVSVQRSMTVTITALDHDKGVATYEGPNGYKYSRRIQDKEMATGLEVGDRLDVTWTAAVQLVILPED